MVDNGWWFQWFLYVLIISWCIIFHGLRSVVGNAQQWLVDQGPDDELAKQLMLTFGMPLTKDNVNIYNAITAILYITVIIAFKCW